MLGRWVLRDAKNLRCGCNRGDLCLLVVSRPDSSVNVEINPLSKELVHSF